MLDIGGGLSTSYTEPAEPEQFSYQAYRAALEQEVPALLTGRYRLVTEMGRSLFLKAGCSITRVEGVKAGWVEGCRPILLTHLGTNQVRALSKQLTGTSSPCRSSRGAPTCPTSGGTASLSSPPTARPEWERRSWSTSRVRSASRGTTWRGRWTCLNPTREISWLF